MSPVEGWKQAPAGQVGCRREEVQELAAGSPRDSRKRVAAGRQQQPAPWDPDTQTPARDAGWGRHRERSTAAQKRLLPMEPQCRTRARRQGPQGRRASAVVLLLLLVLLLLGPAGRLADQTPGTPSKPAPAAPGVPCAPTATCPSGGPRLPRQAPTVLSPPLTLQTSPVSKEGISLFPTCGSSFEEDPTLRDPEAMARRWPWMVSVRANGTHICAGTLIASQWVLTVAHCLIRNDFIYSVRAGSPRIDQISQTTADVPALQVIVNERYQSHRYWSWVGQANNIALVKLAWALKYNTYVWPICLPNLDFQVKDHSVCTVTGWGLPRVDGMWPQFRTIQEKEVTILNNKKCNQFYHKFSKVPSMVQIVDSQMVCAEDSDREHFCYEISGEPLVCPVDTTWYLVGLVSWGPGCEKSKAPPIYLQVTSYRHWIWERVNGQALPAPSRALLLVLALPLSLLVAL
ncbi:probable threonine protease PRSS50 [Panthera uncia]|uniref:probable threonine protease PRSS50 n=1 Tax=Panthera uncia TaxID=29064 RepID=UPI0020FFF414|nr:probable threonine protease PRSS50 [Panthera uncia]